jgi:AcrR family transcriptional regulator
VSRSWAGTTLEDRRARRREQLIEAGIELLGTEGAAAVTVRAVCRQARLTERYFYESFSDRDALLRAVHGRVAEQARDAIAAAVADGPAEPEAIAARAVAAFTAFLQDDPRRGRVLLSESFADSVLAQHGLELIPTFASLLVEQIAALPDPPDETDAQLTALALLGALRALYLGWLQGDPPVSAERLNAHATRLIMATAGVRSGDADEA